MSVLQDSITDAVRSWPDSPFLFGEAGHTQTRHSSAGIARTPLDTAPSMDVKACEEIRKQIHGTAWDCRGWSDSAPYIRSLLDGDYGILVLSEHWL